MRGGTCESCAITTPSQHGKDFKSRLDFLLSHYSGVENTHSTKQAPSPGWVVGLLLLGQHARVEDGKRTRRGLDRAPAAPSLQDLGHSSNRAQWDISGFAWHNGPCVAVLVPVLPV